MYYERISEMECMIIYTQLSNTAFPSPNTFPAPTCSWLLTLWLNWSLPVSLSVLLTRPTQAHGKFISFSSLLQATLSNSRDHVFASLLLQSPPPLPQHLLCGSRALIPLYSSLLSSAEAGGCVGKPTGREPGDENLTTGRWSTFSEALQGPPVL